MDALNMLKTAVILLAITALGGLVLAGIRIITKQNPPAWFAMVHGLLAGGAITLLLYLFCFGQLSGNALLGLGLLVLAALGGVFMNLAYQWQRLLIPTTIVFLHAALAAIGFVLLALTAFG